MLYNKYHTVHIVPIYHLNGGVHAPWSPVANKNPFSQPQYVKTNSPVVQ